MSRVLRLKLTLKDLVRHHPVSRLTLSHAAEKLDRLGRRSDNEKLSRSLDRLTLSARLGYRNRPLDGIENTLLRKLEQWDPSGFAWDRFVRSADLRTIHYSIILKAPRPNGEKGVMFVSFEGNWLRLLRYVDIDRLAREYHLIISPTWSPPYDLPMLLAIKLWPGPLFTTVSALDDIPVLQRLSPKLTVLPLLSSNWVDPRVFEPHGAPQKKYDIAMLANFATYKRHFALFRALRDMSPDTRVLLLGTRWGGRTPETLMAEARAYGVEDRITIMERLPTPEMVRALQTAKVMVIMSLTEGSCVAVAETMFADVPVGLLQGANVGSRAFMNEHTGRFLRPDRLPEDLTQFVVDYTRFHPRRWMLDAGVSYKESCRTLNETLRQTAVANGEPWTTDCKLFHWRPHPEFLTTQDAEEMRPEYERFERVYGIPVYASAFVPVTERKAVTG